MIRALPFLIIFMVMMMGSKVLDVIDLLPITSYFNVQAAAEAPQSSPNSSEDVKADASSPKADVQDVKEQDAKTKEADDHTAKQQEQAVLYSPSEVLVLQELSKRRISIEEREKELSLKEDTLKMVEDNIKQKMEQLNNLQSELKSIIAEYEKHEDEKILRLVKIYESMKPNEAALIFEKLEDDVLLDVASKMKEVKIALILSKMDPAKAKELTMELAQKRRLQQK